MVIREPSNNFTSEITLMLTQYCACVNSIACDYFARRMQRKYYFSIVRRGLTWNVVTLGGIPCPLQPYLLQ